MFLLFGPVDCKYSDQHKQLVKKFDRFEYDIDHNPNKKAQVLNDIKLILYNKRELPLKIRKQSELLE